MGANSRDGTIPVEHVDGLSHIEIIGDGLVRFCLYEARRGANGAIAHVPKLDIIVPLHALPDGIAKAMAVSATELAGKIYRYLPLSMH